MDMMSIYNKLPVFGQNMACYYEGSKIKKSRYGAEFWKLLKEYEERSNWSYEKLCEYRDVKLKGMIKHCYETVPYYTKQFNELGIDYREIKTVEDLKVLPLLTKQMVKDNFSDFISTVAPSDKMIVAHTSGTTGSGFKFYTTNETAIEQWAVWWRFRRALGIGFGTWCALLGGRSVVPVNSSKPPFYRLNTPCKQVYFSTYHMNEDNMKWYIKELERKELKWIHGYPSAINLLAGFMLSHNVKLSYQVEHITIGAENLLLSQIEKIEKAFNVTPYQHYGLSEGVANFSQNRNRDMYVDEDYAAVEFINEREGGSYEVIGSTLSNYAMPLLRYQTGDIASVKITPNSRLVTALDGRSEDYVTLPNGAKIGRLDHVFKDMVNIKEAQIVQRKREKVVLRVVKNPAYTDDDERMLYRETSQRLNGIDIAIEYVELIPRSRSGKLRFVVSELPQ